MELVALSVGLIAAAVVLPALILLCGTRLKDAPVGASMASRRGARAGTLQIDPILQPEWAKKQAAREAQQKKQLTVIMNSNQARLHKVGGAGGGGGGSNGQDHVQIVMRQPSTMADKFALPSHLTKQLGQPSRRPMAPGAHPQKDSSIDGIPPPLSDRKSQSPPVQLADAAFGFSPSTSISRSALNDSSINACISAGGETPELLYTRQVNSNTSTGSRRVCMGISSLNGPESSHMVVPVSEMCTLDSLESLRVLHGGVSGNTWAGANRAGSPASASIPDSFGGQPCASSNATAAGSMAPAEGSPLQSDGPRFSHPRVAALSPMLRSSRPASGGESRSGSNARAVGPFPQMQLQEEDEQEDVNQVEQQPPSSGVVERLVHGINWSAAAVGAENSRWASYPMDTTTTNAKLPPQAAATISCQRLASEPETIDGHGSGGAALATGTAATTSAVDSGTGAHRQLLGSPTSGGYAGGAVSSRDLRGRSAIRLASPLGGRPSLVERELGASANGTSKRWTASDGLAPPAPAVTAFHLEAQLPGSADSLMPRVSNPRSQSGALTAKSQRSILLSGGGSGGSVASSVRGSLDIGMNQSPLDLLCCVDHPSLMASTPAAAAAAAAMRDITKSLGGHDGDGSGSQLNLPPTSAMRTSLTWSSSVAPPLIDVDAGPVMLAAAGEGQLTLAVPGSRAARAQALLARNRTNLSRLAAATAPRSCTIGVGEELDP
ncbi:hypothetical protein Vretimale_18310 [Volvox reticuliferus]|uniref:Uncharacterized protein n=1 Tax=Volvox reticuliferus TaxID=1737510 RepID=A0A8J4FM06_9CHLO|nr:hypothetical protein Vretifemale_8773 [Volvox reticuliferus]GIM15549.1 hypothetical protein Vretimale_18310 [Volvox reticuliferus]